MMVSVLVLIRIIMGIIIISLFFYTLIISMGRIHLFSWLQKQLYS